MQHSDAAYQYASSASLWRQCVATCVARAIMYIRGHVDHGSLVACESVTVWRLVSRMCKQVALCMGLHARLGEDANCWIRILDESLVMMVLPPPPPHGFVLEVQWWRVSAQTLLRVPLDQTLPFALSFFCFFGLFGPGSIQDLPQKKLHGVACVSKGMHALIHGATESV